MQDPDPDPKLPSKSDSDPDAELKKNHSGSTTLIISSPISTINFSI